MGLLLRILVVVAVASTIGIFAGTQARGIRLFPDLQAHREHEEWKKEVAIELDEFRPNLESAGCVVVDARSPEDFSRGRLRAAMILNLPPESITMDVAERLRRTGLPIVIYCSSASCDAAEECFHAIAEFESISDMRIYHPGWLGLEKHPELIDAGPPPDRAWFENPVSDSESASAEGDAELAEGAANPSEESEQGDPSMN